MSLTEDVTATLQLNTFQISTTFTDINVENAIGGWRDGRQEFWFNVKLRDLLGDTYNKYDKFLISFVTDFLQNHAVIPVRSLQFQVGGLNWVNASYDHSSGSNSYWISLPGQQQGVGAGSTGGVIYDNTSQSYVFRKGDPQVQIRFRYIDAFTYTPVTTGTLLPSAFLIFKIQPLKE